MKGFVNINKPTGISSSFVVQKVKKALCSACGQKVKVGHFGTLDPLASGVLPIAVGTATRLFDYAQAKVKVYQATFLFGVETDTFDREGVVTRTSDKIVAREDVQNALKGFIGKIEQIPPQYSAKSVNGKRAYQIAREGKEVELAPKQVEIYDFKLLDEKDGKVIIGSGEYALKPNEFAFEIACGSGTYIRALARDLAASLGTVGYMSSLLRTKSGSFELSDAVTLEEFALNPLAHLKPIEFVTDSFNCYDLDEELKDRALNGVKLQLADMPAGEFVVKIAGETVGIAENLDGTLKFKTRL